MKNLILSALLLIATTMIVVSCQKESIDLDPNPVEGMEETRLHDPVSASVALPDLRIISYTTTVTAKTTLCGPVVIGRPLGQALIQEVGDPIPIGQSQIIAVPLQCPDITCGGQRNFLATVVIKNVGTADLPAGDISVKWNDWAPGEGSTQTQTQPHTGIPIGGTYSMTRPYYMGPCDCIPGGYHKHNFRAIVDPANAIAETNEANNKSVIYKACHGC